MSQNKFNKEELGQMIKADDLKISPFRADGKTYGTPTWIWAVDVDGELYVRAYSGTSSSWYQSAIAQKAGQIHCAGMVKDVNFSPETDEILNQKIDDAYRAKYTSSQYLAPMISERSRKATVKISPKI